MYARNFRVKLKTDTSRNFLCVMANTVIPLLHNQDGFLDEVTFVAEDQSAAMTISFWDSTEHLSAFDQVAASEVSRLLAGVVEGVPLVEVYEVVESNFYRMPVGGLQSREFLP